MKVLNPTIAIAPSELTGKHIVSDILAADVTGDRSNVGAVQQLLARAETLGLSWSLDDSLTEPQLAR